MLNSIFNLFRLENLGVLVIFLIMISVLIAAHEYGHYLFARIFGMGVEEFAIGFGRKPILIYRRKKYLIPLEQGQEPKAHLESLGMHGELSSRDREEILPVVVDTPRGKALQEVTKFTIRAWPIGGFVRIKGMLPEDDGSETHLPGGFYSKAPWQRFIVLLAGPAFSILAGVILLAGLYAAVPTQQPNFDPVFGTISPDFPAAKAGIKTGDRVVSIDGQPINNFFQIIQTVRTSPGKPLAFVLDRAGKQVKATLVPDVDKAPSMVIGPDLQPTTEFKIQGKMMAAWTSHAVRLSFAEAVSRAVATPGEVVSSLIGVLRQPAAIKGAMGGPMTMIAATKDASEDGPGGVVGLAAMLSISVGILNLLPFPPLDGGQMVIAVAEMLRRGRRLSMRVQNAVAMTGMALVMCLVLMVTFFDIQRFTGPKDGGVQPAPPVSSSADTQK